MSKSRVKFVPITERALVQRLRRALKKDGERLLVNRGRQHTGYGDNVGEYYIVDGRQIMTDHDVDLKALATELGVIHPWERVVKQESRS